MSGRARLFSHEPQTYQPHFLHGEERAWTETNCYVDLWIELLHGYGLDPLPALAFNVAIDWEGDAFTFVKPWLEDLYELYGLDTMEHTLWKPLPTHILEQLQQQRPVIVELDSFFLPDTRGTAYQIEHVKTSVACEAIDLERRTLRYFHGRGYHELSGTDFAGAFRLEAAAGSINLPPYVEIVKPSRLQRRPPDELRRLSRAHLRKHLARVPDASPVRRFAADFARDLAWLREQPLEWFHRYSFVSIRQLGAACECAAAYVRWLGVEGTEASAEAFEGVSSSAKALQFRLARAVSTRKPWDPQPSLQSMAEAWDAAIEPLASRFGG
jgi:hypothetical protein